MSAFSAAKRNALVALGLLLILNAGQTSAGEDGQGYLGVMLQDITPSMAKALQLEGQSGVMINQVVDDSPAAQAGLEDGDIILEFQGQPIHDYNDLTRAVRRSPPGEKVELLILHGGKKQTLWVELGEKKKSSGGHVFTNDDEDFWVNGDGKVLLFRGEDDDLDVDGWDFEDLKNLKELEGYTQLTTEHGYLGVQLDDLGEQLAEYFQVKDGKGALVTEVTEDSPAAAAGLKAGDVIIELDGKKIDSTASLHLAMADTEPDQEVEIRVIRKGKNKSLKATLGEVPEGQQFGSLHMYWNDDDDLVVTAPKMLFHGRGHHPRGEYRGRRGDLPPLPDMMRQKQELQQMKEELELMKQELREMKKQLRD